MRVSKDYEEFLRLLNKNKVRYFIVGAYAVAFHARPRYTKDLDLWIEPTPKNAERLLRTLKEFGFGSLRVSEKDLASPGKIIQLGYAPLRIDLLTSVDGLVFGRSWRNRKIGVYGRQRVIFIGKNDLIRNKEASGRDEDKIDLKILLSKKKS